MGNKREILISMGTSKNFLEDVLTRDISTLDALFDLIDNSIDAARDSLIEKGNFKKDKFGLPESYDGFKIDIDISNQLICVEDNCFGMKEKTLQSEAFVIAHPSQHQFGIGQYGIGLKRSLLKMGEKYDVQIDNGEGRYKFDFTNKDIGGTEGKVVAQVRNTRGTPLTVFTVYNLKAEILGDIQNKRWLNRALEGLRDRYSVYFTKGFKITLKYFTNDRVSLDSRLPSLRVDGKFLPTYLPVKTTNELAVTIESGIHEDYFFPDEENYSLSVNRTLTNDFGIYFICNDRVIVKASTEKGHGWKTKWHSEYNGFVCLVRFVAKDPKNLPWNTAKSAMREDAGLFLDVIDHLQPIADTYRSEIKKRYAKNGITKKTSTSTRKPKSEAKPKPKFQPNAKDELPKVRPGASLHRDRDIFVDWNKAITRVPETYQNAYAVFYEMCRLRSGGEKGTPIACLAMFRVLLEETIKKTFYLMGNTEKEYRTLRKAGLKVSEQLKAEDYIDHILAGLVKQYANPDGGIFTFNNIQSQIHSARFHPDKAKVNTYWDELDPFIAACWLYIIENDN